MKRVLAALVVAVGFAGASWAKDSLNFDSAGSISQAVAGIKQELSSLTETKDFYPAPQYQPPSGYYPAPYYPNTGYYYPGYSNPAYGNFERDCEYFYFDANSGLQSNRKWLESRQIIRECHTNAQGQQECHTHYGYIERKDVQVVIDQQRALLPWETERFEVCLEGPRLDFYSRRQAYSYNVMQEGYSDIRFRLTPLQKVAQSPDSDGIQFKGMTPEAASGNMKISFFDRWSEYYKGEKTVLHLTFKHLRHWWFNDVVFERVIDMPANGEYVINTSDYAGPLKAGDSYYAEWSFQRIGKTSTDDEVGGEKTQMVEFK